MHIKSRRPFIHCKEVEAMEAQVISGLARNFALRIGRKFAAFAFGKMINMVLKLFETFCHPLCLHRVYLHFFSPHLQSSLSTFKIKQRRMCKVYVRLELLSIV